MKRLVVVLAMLTLLLPGVGTASAGVDWDGDPLYDVGGVKVHVSYGFAGGDFVKAGGKIAVDGVAPDVRLLGKGPRYVSAKATEGGDAGEFAITTVLSGAAFPSPFQLRVRVPAQGVDQVFDVTNGVPLVFKLVK